MAPPKPRKELARAAAVASKWAFGTPGQSAKQHEAAMRNYEFIQRRLAETGGETSTAEEKIGERWQTTRAKKLAAAPVPKPKTKYKPGDPEWSSDAVLSAEEINRSAKAFHGAKKYRGEAILSELERQGFQPPTSEKQARAQVAQLGKKLTGSSRAAVKAALANPADLAGNADLLGPTAARALAKHAAAVEAAKPPPPPKPGFGHRALDWATPDRASAAVMGVPGLGGPLRDAKELVAGFAEAPVALAETAYQDVRHPGGFLIPKLAKEMLVGWGQGIERATPLPQDLFGTVGDIAHGRFGEVAHDARTDLSRMGTEWREHPFTAALNLYPAVSGAMRLAEVPAMAKRMQALNPGMSATKALRVARKESYVPGWAERQGFKGGIPTRVLRGKLVGDEGELLGSFAAPARGWSRTPLGRKFQKSHDKFSRGEYGPISPKTPGFGRFSETRRAATALRRKRALAWERTRVEALRQMAPIEKYIRQSGMTNQAKNVLLGRVAENRARLAETFYGPQGPSGVSAEETMRAVAADLHDIATNGGVDIPPDTLARIDKQLSKVDRSLERQGLPVNFGQGLWADATNVMRDAGYPEPAIRDNLELMAGAARAWARRGEDRHPQDWLGSPEGRNVAGFVHGAPDAAGLQQTLFQKLFPGEEPVKPGQQSHIPDVQLPEKRTAKNLAAKFSKRSKATGIPETPNLWTKTPEGLPYKIAGDVTPEEWVQRVNAVVPDVAAQENLARWYEHYVPMFRRAFGKDADAIMRGFAVSQANASPASGLGSVLQVMDALREGRKVGKKGFGSVVSENIARAAQNGEIDSSVAAKLSDFIDSLEGRSTRRWMKDNPDAGAPAAVDVHAIRDRGFVDPKLSARMTAVHGHVEGKDFIIEGDGTAAGAKYERIAEWYQKVTDHLNEIEHNGRSDWTPAQAQALGWSAIQMAHRVVPEGFAEAFARNTRAITFEATKGPGKLGENLTLRQSRKVARSMVKDAKRLTKDIPGLYLVDAKVGTGGWAKGSNANITVRVMGSKAAVQQALTTFAQAFDQEWVQATREISGGNSRATLLVHSPRFKNPEMQEKFFAALNRINPELEGFMEYDVGGQPTIAIRTGSPSVTPKTQANFVQRHRAAIEQAERESGISVSTGVRNVEMLTGGQHGEVAPIHTLPGSGGRGLARDALDNPLAAEIRGNLESAVERARGGDLPALSDADATTAAGGVGTLYQRPSRWDGYKANPEAETVDRIRALADRGIDRFEIAQTLIDEDEAMFPGSWAQSGFERNDVLGEYGHEIDRFVERNPDALKTFEQTAAAGEVRGAVQFLDSPGGKQLVFLSEHADPSTFAHEMIGHAAHEMKRELPVEFGKVEKRYGKAYEDWTETEHERFARDAERYLMTGKAPIPELQPVFDRARRWMKQVYESITALGKPLHPETKALLDRYFGKEPLDFTPPKRLRRGLPQPGDLPAIDKLITETGGLIAKGADALKGDPARRLRIAGNMKWLEQQVLPFVDQMDSEVAGKLHTLFDQFDEVKSGSSIFSPEQAKAMKLHGQLLGKRAAEVDKMSTTLRSAPDESVMHMAHDVMETLDDPELTLEELENAVSDLKDVGYEVAKRTAGDNESDKLLSRQVKDLERALKGDRKVNKADRDEAIMIAREISEQMKGIFMDVFGEGLGAEERAALSDSLDRRDNLVSTRLRELNLLKEGTGDGAYVPHYSIFDKLSEQLRGAVRLPAAGGSSRKNLSMKVRADRKTFGKGENKLVRYQTGELNVDIRGLLSAYKNRLRFLETASLRKELFGLGVEVPKSGRVPEGWYIINGTGKAVPQRLSAMRDMSPKEIDELLASGEDFDSMLRSGEGTAKLLEEYKENFLRKAHNGEVPGDWSNDGLRMLPPEVVETMVGKVFEATPGGSAQAIGGMLSLGGRVATIFSHPIGYVNANAAANALMLGLTRPSAMPRAMREFFRIPGSLRASHKELYQDITTETGDVQAGAGLPNFYVRQQTGLENAERIATSAAHTYAGGLGALADQPFRVAAWTGEAKREGFRTPEEWHELLHSDDPKIQAVRDNVSQRTRENMIDFNKLSPQEQRLARYLFIWPFIRGAAAWPIWMTREFGGRMAAVSQIPGAQTRAYEGTGKESVQQRYNKVAPPGDRSMFDISDVPAAGGTIALSSVNPISPMFEQVVNAGKVMNDPKQIGAVVGDMINPGYTSLLEGAFGGRGMDWEKILRSTVPGASYYQALRDPARRGAAKYNDRDSFWDYIRRREGRFTPEDVSGDKVKEAGKKERDEADTRKTWEKAQEEDYTSVDTIVAAIKKKGGNITPASLAGVKKSVEAYHALDAAEAQHAKDIGKKTDDLTETEKIYATEEVIKHYWPSAKLLSEEEVAALPDKARGGKPSKQKYRYFLRDLVQQQRSGFMKLGRDMGAIE